MAVSVTELLKPATHIGDSAVASGGANCCNNVNPGSVKRGGGGGFSASRLNQQNLASRLLSSTRKHTPTLPLPLPPSTRYCPSNQYRSTRHLPSIFTLLTVLAVFTVMFTGVFILTADEPAYGHIQARGCTYKITYSKDYTFPPSLHTYRHVIGNLGWHIKYGSGSETVIYGYGIKHGTGSQTVTDGLLPNGYTIVRGGLDAFRGYVQRFYNDVHSMVKRNSHIVSEDTISSRKATILSPLKFWKGMGWDELHLGYTIRKRYYRVKPVSGSFYDKGYSPTDPYRYYDYELHEHYARLRTYHLNCAPITIDIDRWSNQSHGHTHAVPHDGCAVHDHPYEHQNGSPSVHPPPLVDLHDGLVAHGCEHDHTVSHDHNGDCKSHQHDYRHDEHSTLKVHTLQAHQENHSELLDFEHECEHTHADIKVPHGTCAAHGHTAEHSHQWSQQIHDSLTTSELHQPSDPSQASHITRCGASGNIILEYNHDHAECVNHKHPLSERDTHDAGHVCDHFHQVTHQHLSVEPLDRSTLPVIFSERLAWGQWFRVKCPISEYHSGRQCHGERYIKTCALHTHVYNHNGNHHNGEHNSAESEERFQHRYSGNRSPLPRELHDLAGESDNHQCEHLHSFDKQEYAGHLHSGCDAHGHSFWHSHDQTDINHTTVSGYDWTVNSFHNALENRQTSHVCATISTPTPTVEEPSHPETGNPNQTNTVFTITTNKPTTEDLTLEYTIKGTATHRTDYQTPHTKRGTITIPTGETQTTIPITILSDNITEPDETITITLTTTTTKNATLTITNTPPSNQQQQTDNPDIYSNLHPT